MLKNMFVALLILGSVLFIISIVAFKFSIDLIKKGAKTSATVLELKGDPTGASNNLTPIFLFSTKEGEQITFPGFGATSPPAFKVGEVVKIIYDVKKPTNAKVLSYFGLFGLPIVLLAVALPMIVIGGGYFITNRLFLE
jgi:hypothetical protein